LGFVVGRWDGWNLKNDHTEFEWIVQQLADIIDPIGEPREDLRNALSTAKLIGAMNPEIDDEALSEIAQKLQHYLSHNQPKDDILMPDEADELKREDE